MNLFLWKSALHARKGHEGNRFLPSPRALAREFLLGTLLLGLQAFAQSAHPAHPQDGRDVVFLSFQEALTKGATSGPEVTYAMAPHAAANEAIRYSNPPFTQVPVVQTQIGPRFLSTKVAPELVASLSQPIPLTNTGRAQEILARAELAAIEKDTELAALDSAERAGHAWIDLAYAEELLSLRLEAQKQAKLHLGVVESRIEVGAIDQGDLALAQSELAGARSLVLDAEGQHFLAAHELAYLTGLSQSQRADVKTRLSDAPLLEQGTSTLTVHPSLASAEARANASKQEIGYAKSQQVPMMSFGVQYQREGTGEQVLTGIFTFPLALSQPWRFQEARQRIHYDQARAKTKLLELELKRELERALHERDHATAQYDLLKSAAIPPREDALRIALAKFEVGDVDFLHVSWAKRELLGAQERLVMALSNLHHSHLRLLHCTGALKDLQK